MSLDYCVYVAAYVKLPVVDCVEKYEITACSNKNCINSKGSEKLKHENFCSKCGSKIVSKEISNVKRGELNWYDFLIENDLPEEVFSLSGSYLTYDIDVSIDVKYSDNNANEIKYEEIPNKIKEFKENFKEYADKLKELYNVELEVKYGVINYCS